MNKDLALMIELQHLWDRMLEAKEQVERCTRSISHWEQDIKDRNRALDDLSNQIKNLKGTIKTSELDLATLDEKIRKQEERRNILKSAREIDALENELIKTEEEKSLLEDKLLQFFDDLEKKETKLEHGIKDSTAKDLQARADIDELKKKLAEWDEKTGKLEKEITSREEGLSPVVRSRFKKQVSAKGGKGVAELKGEVCANCNTQIPSSLASDVSRGDSLVICTNCGRYLYSKSL